MRCFTAVRQKHTRLGKGEPLRFPPLHPPSARFSILPAIGRKMRADSQQPAQAYAGMPHAMQRYFANHAPIPRPPCPPNAAGFWHKQPFRIAAAKDQGLKKSQGRARGGITCVILPGCTRHAPSLRSNCRFTARFDRFCRLTPKADESRSRAAFWRNFPHYRFACPTCPNPADSCAPWRTPAVVFSDARRTGMELGDRHLEFQKLHDGGHQFLHHHHFLVQFGGQLLGVHHLLLAPALRIEQVDAQSLADFLHELLPAGRQHAVHEGGAVDREVRRAAGGIAA